MNPTVTVQRDAGIEWCVTSRAIPGQTVSGDQHVVAAEGESVMLAVVDGLGHGDDATLAARKATEILGSRAGEPLVAVLQECHRALRHTRGAVMTLVTVNARARTATALGVGNVEAVIVRADRQSKPPRDTVLLRNGVVGYQLPPLQTSEYTINPGDLLVFATDGIREDFAEQLSPGEPLQQLVERVLTQKFRGTDDGLVLACRILDDDEN